MNNAPDPVTPAWIMLADAEAIADLSERDRLLYLPTEEEIQALAWLEGRYDSAAAIFDSYDAETGTIEIPVQDLYQLTIGDGGDAGTIPCLCTNTALARLVWCVAFEA